jgi:8-oxo-dGTP diphosphatase
LWLLLQNARRRDWGFPKGHQDPGENFSTTALRECAEECGIGLLALDGPAVDLTYQTPSGKTKLVRYFPARTCQERVTLSSEHCDAAWFSADEILAHCDFANLRDGFSQHLEALR